MSRMGYVLPPLASYFHIDNGNKSEEIGHPW